jgi:ferrochelatase
VNDASPLPPPAPTRRRLAVVLFQLGGPDRPEAVKPFLVNLFSDPAILRVPNWLRPWLAKLIAGRRLKPAMENYAILGGKSPLLELTEQQARALEGALAGAAAEVRCFIAMRYWHPFTEEAVAAIKAFGPDEIVALPLYPQFSTTTTGSSMTVWREAVAKAGITAPVRTLCCFHSDGAYAAAQGALVARALDDAQAEVGPEVGVRILFSAHGLPESIVTDGDPYQWQVEQTVKAVLRAMGRGPLPHTICYQSRVTPQKWIGPSTTEAIEDAAEAGEAVLVVPIAFVSEHSETLVELDVEYREEAEEMGIKGYFRAPAPNSDPAFIAALADLVRGVLARPVGLSSFGGPGLCPGQHRRCPHATAAATQEKVPATA